MCRYLFSSDYICELVVYQAQLLIVIRKKVIPTEKLHSTDLRVGCVRACVLSFVRLCVRECVLSLFKELGGNNINTHCKS